MPMTFEQRIAEESKILTPCPLYERCKRGKAVSSEECGVVCMVYGCSTEESHSVLHRIASGNGKADNSEYRRLIISELRKIFD
jgi:hypothetical protein